MLNKYVWGLYLRNGGDELAAFFKKNLTKEISPDFPDRIFKLQRYYCAFKSIAAETEDELEALRTYYEEHGAEIEAFEAYPEDTEDLQQALSDIDAVFGENYEGWEKAAGTDKAAFDFFIRDLAGMTTELSYIYPGLFIPYYFFANYNVLTLIADTFGIVLPDLPKKADYKGRTWQYASLCKAFYTFRRKNGLSCYEFCAFLYDFAPHYIGGTQSYIFRNLPEPKAAYFVGGGGDNSDAVAEDDPEMVAFWQCSPDTRAGDMIVMYLRTPVSSISSIWRAVSVGFCDPFFYYYRCTYIGQPRKIPRIPLPRIKTDPVLGKMPIVSKNMQGINGVELKPSEYNYIVEKSNIDVPKLEYSAPDSNCSYVNEKEVEEKLIKPLLAKLGYGQEDYVQQMRVEIGNHNYALIPDFVLRPVSFSGHYSGFAIVEAKRSISSAKQLEEVKTQARSYAKLLGVSYSVVAAMEKVWVMAKKDDYSDPVFEETWERLSDSDVLYQLQRLIGVR